MQQKGPPTWEALFVECRLATSLCALDLAGLHAAGADVGLADMALGVADGDLLDVRTEDAVGDLVRVADIAACYGVLTADFTYFRHCFS